MGPPRSKKKIKGKADCVFLSSVLFSLSKLISILGSLCERLLFLDLPFVYGDLYANPICLGYSLQRMILFT